MLTFRKGLLVAISLTAFTAGSAASVTAGKQPSTSPPEHGVPTPLRNSPADRLDVYGTAAGAPDKTWPSVPSFGVVVINSVISAGSWLVAPAAGQ